MGAVLELGLLGPLDVRIDGGLPVAVGGVRQKALLAVLALHANEVVSTDRLVDELWGENAPATAVHTVQVFISRMRGALGSAAGRLLTRPPGYTLVLGVDEVDAARCERLYDAARFAMSAGDAARAAALLADAEALWRGPPLADFAYEPFAAATIARLDELRVSCREELVDAELAMGRHAEVVSDLKGLVREHPFRERSRGQLMLALYRCGRQADALDAFQQTRRMFVDELGLEPSSALRALEQAILRQDPSLDASRPVTITDPPAVGEISREAKGGLDGRTIRLPLPWPLERAGSGAFVGREDELARTLAWWTQAGDEPPRPVLVIGEAGMGKTRLASQLGRVAHTEGALVLYGHCDEEVASPYQPFVEALRPYATALGSDGLKAELGQHARELGRLWPELASFPPPVHADPEWGQAALFDAVRALLEAAARGRRLLLVLDDVHWAAGSTVLLLRHLLGPNRPPRALILVGYRERALRVGSPMHHLVAHLHSTDDANVVSLEGLDEAAIAELVADASGGADATRDRNLARILRAQTSGNPFFVRELLVHLATSGALSREPPMRGPIDLPERLRTVILERVARLSQLSRQSLSVGAVAGMTFPLPLVERVVGESQDVLGALDEGVEAGIVADAGRGKYTFAHALVRQALYESLASARRIRLHRLLGETLETLPRASATADELARHFAEAASDGAADKAVRWAIAAGREAAAGLGFEEAATHYVRGLESLQFSEAAQADAHAELLLALGDAQWRVGDVDAAKRTCLEASELGELIGAPALLAHAALGFAGPFLLELGEQDVAPAVRLLTRALGALDPDRTDQTVLRASVMARLAACLAYGRPEDRRPDLARDALEMVRPTGDSIGLAFVLAMYHHVNVGPDKVHESLSAAVELARVTEAIGDRQLELEARDWAIDHMLELGLADAAQQELKALQALASDLEDRFSKWLMTVALAREAQFTGRLDEFEALAYLGLQLGFESRNRSAGQIFGGQMIALRREQGRLAEVVEGAEALTAQFPGIHAWRCTLAYIYAELEREASARQELDLLAADAFRDIPRDGLWLASLATLSEVVTFLGDSARAGQLYELLRPYWNRNIVLFGVLCLGSVSRHLGMLATTMSRYEQAAHHFRDAQGMHERLGSEVWVAHTTYNQARLLLSRDQPGDHEQAVVLLEEVLAASERHGYDGLAARARRLSGASQQPSEAAASLG